MKSIIETMEKIKPSTAHPVEFKSDISKNKPTVPVHNKPDVVKMGNFPIEKDSPNPKTSHPLEKTGKIEDVIKRAPKHKQQPVIKMETTTQEGVKHMSLNKLLNSALMDGVYNETNLDESTNPNVVKALKAHNTRMGKTSTPDQDEIEGKARQQIEGERNARERSALRIASGQHKGDNEIVNRIRARENAGTQEDGTNWGKVGIYGAGGLAAGAGAVALARYLRKRRQAAKDKKQA